MARHKSPSMTPDTFVTEWIESFKRHESLQDMARRLGRVPADLRKRKTRYIRKGVNLPELKDVAMNTNAPIDPERLNELMKELL